MRAVVLRHTQLVVETVPDPVPGPGEVLVRTLACGICGSDLHARKFGAQMVKDSQEMGSPFVMDLAAGVVMGHEFAAEVLDYGPGTERKLKTGTRVVSVPLVMDGAFPKTVGYSNDKPGGYGELMLLQEALLLPVPNGLPTERAALTEPMAVGYHAVMKAKLAPGDAPLVIGCGPVGLAVIAGLKLVGAGPIVAADFSPMRRELARKLGADLVIDPKVESPWAASAKAAPLRPTVAFECVGVPGMLQGILRDAPPATRVVVVGVCMEDDRIRPMFAITKELNLQFVLGYTPEEFAITLRELAEGRIDGGPIITGRVGLEKVGWAFDELGKPDQHAKILVEPGRA